MGLWDLVNDYVIEPAVSTVVDPISMGISAGAETGSGLLKAGTALGLGATSVVAGLGALTADATATTAEELTPEWLIPEGSLPRLSDELATVAAETGGAAVDLSVDAATDFGQAALYGIGGLALSTAPGAAANYATALPGAVGNPEGTADMTMGQQLKRGIGSLDSNTRPRLSPISRPIDAVLDVRTAPAGALDAVVGAPGSIGDYISSRFAAEENEGDILVATPVIRDRENRNPNYQFEGLTFDITSPAFSDALRGVPMFNANVEEPEPSDDPDRASVNALLNRVNALSNSLWQLYGRDGLHAELGSARDIGSMAKDIASAYANGAISEADASSQMLALEGSANDSSKWT